MDYVTHGLEVKEIYLNIFNIALVALICIYYYYFYQTLIYFLAINRYSAVTHSPENPEGFPKVTI